MEEQAREEEKTLDGAAAEQSVRGIDERKRLGLGDGSSFGLRYARRPPQAFEFLQVTVLPHALGKLARIPRCCRFEVERNVARHIR